MNENYESLSGGLSYKSAVFTPGYVFDTSQLKSAWDRSEFRQLPRDCNVWSALRPEVGATFLSTLKGVSEGKSHPTRGKEAEKQLCLLLPFLRPGCSLRFPHYPNKYAPFC